MLHYEVGYMHLSATLLAAGMADGRIPACSTAAAEKRTVRRLLDARYAIDGLPLVAHDTLSNLIHRGLQDWWRTSRYNVPLSALSDEVMSALAGELTSAGLTVRRPTGPSHTTLAPPTRQSAAADAGRLSPFSLTVCAARDGGSPRAQLSAPSSGPAQPSGSVHPPDHAATETSAAGAPLAEALSTRASRAQTADGPTDAPPCDAVVAVLRAAQEKINSRYSGLIFYWRVEPTTVVTAAPATLITSLAPQQTHGRAHSPPNHHVIM